VLKNTVMMHGPMNVKLKKVKISFTTWQKPEIKRHYGTGMPFYRTDTNCKVCTRSHHKVPKTMQDVLVITLGSGSSLYVDLDLS
jgi:hypothetical protein